MSFCLNPACSRPENPDSNRFCQGCGAELAQNRISYDFRVHYRVIQLLGEGAFGRTYLAKDVDFMEELRVIKKFIAQGQGKNLQKAKDLFKQEAQRLYELNHPQIPKLYAHFEQENSLYLVQEFIEGKDLWQEFLKQREFDEQKVVNLLQDLLPVLQYLHTNHILHRDIKPENIMRRSTSSPKGGQLILIDFGGAKQITEILPMQTRTAIYTWGYAATEHIAGKPKPASDIYSLGVTCIRLMTGCFPQEDSYGNLQDEIYDADNGRWLWREHLPRGVRISLHLGQVLDKMLEHFARNRYQSVQEVLEALNTSPQQTLPAVTRQPVPQRQNPQPVIPTEISAQPKPPQPPRRTPIVSRGNILTRKRFLQLAGWGSVSIIVVFVIGSVIFRQGNGWTKERFLKWMGWGGVGVGAAVAIGWVLSRRDSPQLLLRRRAQKPIQSPVSEEYPPQPTLKRVGLEPSQFPVSERNIPQPPFERGEQEKPGILLPEVPSGYTLRPFAFDAITVNARGEEINRETEEVQYFTVDLGKGVRIDMVAIPGGRFLMGSPETEEERRGAEEPQHWVDVLPFFMSKYAVTQAQYKAVMNTNPSYFKGDNRPVETVFWEDATEFCQKISQKTGLEFRLPSEAEWEYACRAISPLSKGGYSPFHFGETITTDLANYDGNYTYADALKGQYRQETTPVGQFPPNEFGLYDMHGNVWEWCADHWHNSYAGAPADGSMWLSSNESNPRVLRGGSWKYVPENCRCAYRTFYRRTLFTGHVIGFRVVCGAGRTL